MATIDLAARRAARAAEEEHKPQEHWLRVDDKHAFRLPDKLPAMFVIAASRVAEGDMAALEQALGYVFGERTEEILALLDLGELNEVMGDVTALYGVSLGEASASDGSSSNTGPVSRPTSNASTDSI